MDTFLSPIEKPRGLIMKLAYYFTRRQFGKVLTPLKVHSARLPAAFGTGLAVASWALRPSTRRLDQTSS
jgi:hypothetical protein